MSKKFQMFLALFLALSLILSACGAPAAEPVVEATEESVAEVITEEPVVVEGTGPDLVATFDALVNSLPTDTGYGTIRPAPLSEELAEKMPFLLDVREVAEVEADGYLEGAVNIPVREVLNNLDKLPDLDEPIVVYCKSGHRGAFVFAALKLLGYTDVRNLNGGLNAWKKAELPVVTGSLPEAPASISAPIIADQSLFETLNGFFTNLPEGFYNTTADGLAEKLTGSILLTIIDLRTQPELDREGYIEGSIHIPMQELFTSLDELPGKDEPIVVYCAGGQRSAIVLEGLTLLGYTNVINLGGGYNAWKAAGMPVVGLAPEMASFLTNLPTDAGFYSIKTDKLNELLAESAPFIVDVREPAELEANGFIAGSINIPIRDLLKNLDKLPAKDQKIIITCASGHRGSLGMMALRLLGYTDVVNLNGGLNAWIKAELPVEKGAPVAPTAGTAPEVDAAALAALDAYLSGLPEGFGAIKSPDFNTELVSGAVPFMLDVRTTAEWDANGHIEGAINVPVNDVPANLAQLPADKAAPIMVICASGHRGAMTQMYLQFLGYTDVRNLNGGMNGWIAAQLSVVK